MKIAITLEFTDVESASRFAAVAKKYEGEAVETSVDDIEETPTAPKKRGPKKPKPAPVEAEESNEDDDMGLGDDEPEVEPEEPSDISADDVTKAFKDYVKSFGDVKAGRDAARKILKKFDVDHIDSLSEDDYEAVIKSLKAKKK